MLPTEPSFAGPRIVATPATAGRSAEIQACFDGAPRWFAVERRTLLGDEAATLLADAEADPQRRVYAVALRAGGPAIGVLDLHLDYPDPGTAHIGLLLLRESAQGQGYGAETVAALEAALARAGYGALRLSVVDENVEARLFWERVGFAPAGRLPGGVTVYEKPI